MLHSVLLHLQSAGLADTVIRLGVPLASGSGARVRGLTLLDTRRVESALSCESAVFALMAHSRRNTTEREHESVRADFSQACLDAGLNFDIRLVSGDPLFVLPREAHFHDLVITSVGANGGSANGAGELSSHDVATLLERGVQPLMVLHAEQKSVERVLLVYDGSEAASRTIRSYLGLEVFSSAAHRLLAIGANEQQSRAALREMGDYCTARNRSLEVGCATGAPRRVVAQYAEKWQADLVVLGISRGNRLLRGLLRHSALDLSRRLACGLYLCI